MKTTKQVIEQSNIPAKLIRAVVRQIGDKDSLRDVAAHGADAGFSGFTYYTDTVAFYKRNRADIIKLAENMADDLGEDMIAMVGSFRCISNGGKPDYTAAEIGEAIWQGKGEGADIIRNALAWFALEEVARAFCDE